MIALLLAELVAMAAPQATAPSISSTLDTAVVTVGDRLHLTVRVTHDPARAVRWPDSLDLGPFEVLERAVPGLQQNLGSAVSTLVLTLTTFETGDHELPSFDVHVTGGPDSAVLATNGWDVTVESVGLDEGGEIRDVKGPLSIPRNWLLLLPWLLSVVGLAVLGYWLYRRYARRERRAPMAPVVPAVPPHVAAHRALDDLERSGMLQRGEVKHYHIRVSEIIRGYLHARYGVDALEMATVEVMEGLAGVVMADDARDEIRRFLETCDLVKFAKMTPAPERCREMVPAARRIVDAAVPTPVPEEQEVAG